MTPLWHPDPETRKPDSRVAFRATFELAQKAEIEVRLLGASWFVAWLDGVLIAEGPARFTLPFPEYQPHTLSLPAGKHVLAVQVHHFGVPTRLLENPPPFLWAELVAGERPVPLPLTWRCLSLPGYSRTGRRLNGQLGWSEWCDTRPQPAHWQALTFDDKNWQVPPSKEFPLGTVRPLSAAPARIERLPLRPLATGTLTETFGYESDNPQARFFLRELTALSLRREGAGERLPPQGIWRRYDLGRIRLAHPRLVLDLPAGAIVEFAQSESLQHGRVSPWVTLSASDSCFLDHFVARGGEQEFFPLHPKGGRYLEVHVLAPPGKVRFVREEAIERTYFGKQIGELFTGDKLLDKIWQVGVETLRACSEDAIVDTPTRERGQWAGDVVSVLDADIIFVYGNVNKQGALKIRDQITLTQAIASAEGLLPAADKGKVRILRQLPGKPERDEFVFDLNQIDKGKVKDPILEPNDIVAVSQDKSKAILLGIGSALKSSVPSAVYRLPGL